LLSSEKLDFTTGKDWELEVAKADSDSMLFLEALLGFLTNRAHTLELVEGTKNKLEIASRKLNKRVNVVATSQLSCAYCERLHHIARCEKFQRLSISEKKEEVKRRQLCFNCLRKGHYMQACTASVCKFCSKKHNTILHTDREEQSDSKCTKNKQHQTINTNPILQSQNKLRIIQHHPASKYRL